jgi:hypothetical protein
MQVANTVAFHLMVQENNMLSFKTFLSEAAADNKQGKLLHLQHTSDGPMLGDEGLAGASQANDALRDSLLGKKTTHHISTKFDGAPSVVFGTHPVTKKYFVATKSAFNKDPKINYSEEDIDRNHGHAPGLASKLKEVLKHGQKILPREGGVFQGDLMHTEGDVQSHPGTGMVSTTPNTVTYSAHKDSPEGRAMANSKLGMVVHTKYSGKGDLQNMQAGPLDHRTRSKFVQHPDVNNIDPTFKPNPANFTPEELAQYEAHNAEAKKIYRSMKPEDLSMVAPHAVNLQAHINKGVRQGTEPSVDEYMQDVTARANKDMQGKTQKTIERKSKEHADNLAYIHNNRPAFEKALKLHQALRNANDVLVNSAAKNSPFMHTINGETTQPEGLVSVSKDGNMFKHVNRAEFSRQNFLKNQGGSFKQAPVGE